MNHIDQSPFGKTPVSFSGKIFGLLSELSMLKWFDQIYQALLRPTMTANVAFIATPTGTHAVYTFNFPKNSVKPGDGLVLGSPVPPSGTCFTVHCSIPDVVQLLFHNYSGFVSSFPLGGTFTVTVLTT